MKTKLTDRASIPQVLKEMTVAEKLTLLTGAGPFHAGGNAEHGIPEPIFLDGGTGFNTMQMRGQATFQAVEEVLGKTDPEACDSLMGGFSAIMSKRDLADPKRIAEILDETRPADGELGCYPPGMLFGATMNPEVIHECGVALGREAVTCHVDVLLGTPNVNILRDPRNGRLFEGYSEDPVVVSTLAPAFVKGIQEAGVVADVKHYAANNSETDRMGVDEHIEERTLREIYLPGFKACIDAGCKTVMSSYNSINGVPSAHNPFLLKQILRDEWGFKGFVMSDWGAVYDRVAAQKAGNDVCMPGPREISSLLKAVEEGILTEAEIDEACTNYLNILLEMPIMTGVMYPEIDKKRSMDAAYHAAAEGLTLLKNEDVLPLSRHAGVAFYGPRSKKFTECGAGSAEVLTPLSTNMYDSTVEKIGAELVSYNEITEATDYVVVTVGANGQEGADRVNMFMEPEDVPVIEKAIADAKAANKPVILVLNIAGPIDISAYLDDVAAILCVYLPGMGGGRAAADILFGDVNPSGKLPLTMPLHYTDTPTYGNFPGINKKLTYGEGIYVGYRYYDTRNVQPMFPFGHGLSYTKFAFSNLQVSPVVDFDNGETVKVSVDIKNVGRMAGSEVVQVYVSDVESTLDKPAKELKCLKKVFLQPGEKTAVSFEITGQELASFDMLFGEWITEPGEFKILVGASSRDIRVTAMTKVKCLNVYGLSPDTEISKVVLDPTANEIFNKHIPGFKLAAACNVRTVFAPKTPFSEAWDNNIAPLLSGTEEEKKALYEAILADFREVNREGKLIVKKAIGVGGEL